MLDKMNVVARLSMAVFSLTAAAVGHAADSGATTRIRTEGSPYFLDEAAVKMKNDVATFKLYTSPEASDLVPLMDIASVLVHPVKKKSIRELALFADVSGVRKFEG